MKKLFIIIGFFMLLSCNNKNKNNLKEFLKGADYTYQSNKISDFDYYDLMYNENTKKGHEEQNIYYTNLAGKYLDSMGKSKKDKEFEKVVYFELIGKDTLHNGYAYYNENNKRIKILRIK